MAKAPYILLRDTIAAYITAGTYTLPVVVQATHRPIVELPADVGSGILVNVFHANRRSAQETRGQVDRTYETIVALHQQLQGDTEAELDAVVDTFEFVAHEIELRLERTNFVNDGFLWLEFESPGADRFPFIAEVYDQATHLLSVLQVTHLENPV